jgi:hypothetical protein
MTQITLSAIGDIIDKTLPHSQTAVELLKLTYDFQSKDTVQDSHRTYGDDIINHLLPVSILRKFGSSHLPVNQPFASSSENDRSQYASMQIMYYQQNIEMTLDFVADEFLDS